MPALIEKTPEGEVVATLKPSAGRLQVDVGGLLLAAAYSSVSLVTLVAKGRPSAFGIGFLAFWLLVMGLEAADLTRRSRLTLTGESALIEMLYFDRVISRKRFTASQEDFYADWPPFVSRVGTPSDPVRLRGSELRLGATMLSRHEAGEVVEALNAVREAAEPTRLTVGDQGRPLRRLSVWLPLISLLLAFLVAPSMAIQVLYSVLDRFSSPPAATAAVLLAPVLALAALVVGVVAFLKRERTREQAWWFGPAVAVFSIAIALWMGLFAVDVAIDNLPEALSPFNKYAPIAAGQPFGLDNGVVLTPPVGWSADVSRPDSERSKSPAPVAQLVFMDSETDPAVPSDLVGVWVGLSRSVMDEWQSQVRRNSRDATEAIEVQGPVTVALSSSCSATIWTKRYLQNGFPRVQVEAILEIEGHRPARVVGAFSSDSPAVPESLEPREAFEHVRRLIKLELPGD